MSSTSHSQKAVDRIKSDVGAAVLLERLYTASISGPSAARGAFLRAIEGVERLLADGVSPSEMSVGLAAERGKFERATVGL